MIKKIGYVYKYYNTTDWQAYQRHAQTRSFSERVHVHDCVRQMALVTWVIVLMLPTVVVGNNNESLTIPLQSIAQVVKEIYQKLHSTFVILLYEFMKNEGRKYISIWHSLLCCSYRFIHTLIKEHYLKPYVTEWEGKVIMNSMDFEHRSCDLF